MKVFKIWRPIHPDGTGSIPGCMLPLSRGSLSLPSLRSGVGKWGATAMLRVKMAAFISQICHNIFSLFNDLKKNLWLIFNSEIIVRQSAWNKSINYDEVAGSVMTGWPSWRCIICCFRCCRVPCPSVLVVQPDFFLQQCLLRSNFVQKLALNICCLVDELQTLHEYSVAATGPEHIMWYHVMHSLFQCHRKLMWFDSDSAKVDGSLNWLSTCLSVFDQYLNLPKERCLTKRLSGLEDHRRFFNPTSNAWLWNPGDENAEGRLYPSIQNTFWTHSRMISLAYPSPRGHTYWLSSSDVQLQFFF